MKKTISASVLVLILSSCGGGGSSTGNKEPTIPPPVIQPPEEPPAVICEANELSLELLSETISSVYTGGDYPLQYYVPETYSFSSNSYPLVILLDAEWHFERVKRAFIEANIEAIVIGVENDTSDGYEHREFYFQHSGSDEYIEFVTLELLPLIKTQLNINEQSQTLIGHSFSGLFSAKAMLFDESTPLSFQQYVALDGSFWADRTLTRLLVEEKAEVEKTNDVLLRLVGATGLHGNNGVVNWFSDRLNELNFPPQVIYSSTEVGHHSVVSTVIDEVLQDLKFEIDICEE